MVISKGCESTIPLFNMYKYNTQYFVKLFMSFNIRPNMIFNDRTGSLSFAISKCWDQIYANKHELGILDCNRLLISPVKIIRQLFLYRRQLPRF